MHVHVHVHGDAYEDVCVPVAVCCDPLPLQVPESSRQLAVGQRARRPVPPDPANVCAPLLLKAPRILASGAVSSACVCSWVCMCACACASCVRVRVRVACACTCACACACVCVCRRALDRALDVSLNLLEGDLPVGLSALTALTYVTALQHMQRCLPPCACVGAHCVTAA